MSQLDALAVFKLNGHLTIKELASLLGRSYNIARTYVRSLGRKGYLDSGLEGGVVRYWLK